MILFSRRTGFEEKIIWHCIKFCLRDISPAPWKLQSSSLKEETVGLVFFPQKVEIFLQMLP